MESDSPEFGSQLNHLLKCDPRQIILLLSYAWFPQERKKGMYRYNKNYCKGLLYLKEGASANMTTLQFCLIKADILNTFTKTPKEGKTEKQFNSVWRASTNLLSREQKTKKKEKDSFRQVKMNYF